MKRVSRSYAWYCLAISLALALVATLPAAGQSSVPTAFAFDTTLAGDEELRLRWPTAVAAGGVDEIAVADAAGPRLVVFRDIGGGEGWVVHASVALPAAAYSLSCGSDHYLLSTRQPGILLAVERADFTLREIALPPRITPGAVTCLADDRILVHDLASGNLVVLDRALEVRATVELDDTVAAVATGSGTGFYATFPATGEVRRYGANGDQLSVHSVPGREPAPAWPVGLTIEDNGEILVVDRQGGRIILLDTSGRWIGTGSRKGWEPGLLRSPADLARLPDGRVVVADQGNGRVQLFRRLKP